MPYAHLPALLRHGLALCFLLLTTWLFPQYLPPQGTYHHVPTTDGVDLYVLELGNSKAPHTYIVLHGGFGAEHSYLIDPLLPHTANNRFILYDQRGSLRSSAPDSLITFAGFVQDLEQIRKAFGLPKVRLLAHSNGTTIALDHLAAHPDVVDHVILLACPLSVIDGSYFHHLDQPLAQYQGATAPPYG